MFKMLSACCQSHTEASEDEDDIVQLESLNAIVGLPIVSQRRIQTKIQLALF